MGKFKNFCVCGYCAELMFESQATLDHITAASKGGTDKEDNLALCCEECNQNKGNKDSKPKYRCWNDLPKDIQDRLFATRKETPMQYSLREVWPE